MEIRRIFQYPILFNFGCFSSRYVNFELPVSASNADDTSLNKPVDEFLYSWSYW